MKRDIKVGIKSDDEFFAEAREIARIDSVKSRID